MAKKTEKVVLDTNIFIYFLISDSFRQLEMRLKNHELRLLFSEELLEEFMEVVSRPKFKKYFSDKDISNMLLHLHNYADLIQVKSSVSVCLDRKDNFLLELCLDGKADYLITGDDDLLVLKKLKKTSIIKIKDFLQKK